MKLFTKEDYKKKSRLRKSIRSFIKQNPSKEKEGIKLLKKLI